MALAVAYAVSGWLGLLVASSPGNVTALWPPSGLALAALVWVGRRAAPGVFLGSLITNLVFFPGSAPGSVAGIAGAVVIALGSTTEIVVAAWLLEGFAGGIKAVSSLARVVAFAAIAFGSAAVAASTGLLSTAALGGLPEAAWPRFWLTWMLGDALGMLAITPLVLQDGAPRRPSRWGEGIASAVLTLVVAQLVFGRPFPVSTGTDVPVAWALLPAVMWAGTRLGARGVAGQTLLLHVLISWGTVMGQGPFAGDALAMLLVDGLLLVGIMPGLMLSAIVARSEVAKAELERERALLEQRVAERTHAVERAAREHARLHDSLVEAQKQEAVGRLAGGVAHDFNNLLTVIGGQASLLEQSATTSEERDGLRSILAAAQRAGELTSQLLAVARRPLSQSATVDVGAALTQLRRLLRPALPESVKLDIESEVTEPTSVALDGVQLEQVLLNLALNARDAMPAGGHLRIVHKLQKLDVTDPEGLAAGTWVTLAVIDDGAGIAAAALPHVFEPFFTTKGGGGTGLGLSTAAGIVGNAGGRINVTSAPGAGTTFTVWLPQVAPATPPVEEATTSTSTRSRQGRRVILLAEDEPLVRRLIMRALERLGHQVVATNDGEEALAVARQQPRIDLLLSDVVMPRLGGVELAKAVRDLHPRVVVILMSGYHEEQKELKSERLLPKPFTPDQLLRTIGEGLEKIEDARTAD